MVGELRIHIQNRTINPLAVALSGVGERSKVGDDGSYLINVECKPIQNCCNQSSLHKNEGKNKNSDLRAPISTR
jgi:hypothetical protein